MASIKDIKNRIKGVTGIRKITKAMKSMALIRLQRAEARALASRPFIFALTDIVCLLESDSPYIIGNGAKDSLIVIFTSDRGLCGSFNETIIRKAEELIEEKSKTGKVKLILVGTKAVIHFARKGHEIVSMYTHLPTDPTASLSDLVMNDCRNLFTEKKVGEIILVYQNFKSKIKYEIKVKKLLPLPQTPKCATKWIQPIFIFEPERSRVIDMAIGMFLESTVFHSFLDLYASEYSARLAAMSKATDSADDMISDLTLEMNKTRQAMITKELLEVISGAEAINQ